MFWTCLIILYLATFPVNDYLLRRIWRSWYPPDAPLLLTPPSQIPPPDLAIARARAVLCFGIVQPAMAAVPLLLGTSWHHWGICAIASAWYAASGSPRFCLNIVRASNILRVTSLLSFSTASAIIASIQHA